MKIKKIKQIIAKEWLAALGTVLLGVLVFFIISNIDRYIKLNSINNEKIDSTSMQSAYNKIKSEKGLTDEEMKKLILKKISGKVDNR